MNFIFLSPHFPAHYVNFADRLKKMGVNVLGIADASYDSLSPELKDSLTEYYRVDNMENYDELVRAVGYFIHKYGRIDALNSLNEYWLETDAKLRTDFNIPGTKYPQVLDSKNKSKMKAHYEKAGIPVARYHLVTTLEEGKKFAEKVGYPLFVKPDNGVGAYASYPIANENDLVAFYNDHPDVPYIMEEYIEGDLLTFDGITDYENNIIFNTNHVFPVPVADVVNKDIDLFYLSNKEYDEKLEEAGRKTVAAYDMPAHFFHFEFFRLTKDKKGVGKKGDIVGLEVNMRPPGGIMPELMDYEHDIDVYQVWADMMVHDKLYVDIERKYVGIYVSRRDHHNYQHTHEEIMEKYGEYVMQYNKVDDIFSAVMGNHVYLMRAENKAQAEEMIDFVVARV